MFDQVLINFEKYNHIGLLFNGLGCLMWVAAYVILIKEIRQKAFVEMPVYVAGANIGWELVWGLVYHPDTGLLFALSYTIAFFLDCYIFYHLLHYGTKQPIPIKVKNHFRLYSLINFIFWILFSYLFKSEGYDSEIGALSGYIINVILSLQCLALLVQVEDTNNFSLVFAISKMVGTALITVSLFFFYPDNQFVQLLGVSCFIMDTTYIVVLYRRRKIVQT